MIPSDVSANPTKIVKKLGMAQGSLCQKYSIAPGWIESSGIGNMESSIVLRISPQRHHTFAKNSLEAFKKPLFGNKYFTRLHPQFRGFLKEFLETAFLKSWVGYNFGP